MVSRKVPVSVAVTRNPGAGFASAVVAKISMVSSKSLLMEHDHRTTSFSALWAERTSWVKPRVPSRTIESPSEMSGGWPRPQAYLVDSATDRKPEATANVAARTESPNPIQNAAVGFRGFGGSDCCGRPLTPIPASLTSSCELPGDLCLEAVLGQGAWEPVEFPVRQPDVGMGLLGVTLHMRSSCHFYWKPG